SAHDLWPERAQAPAQSRLGAPAAHPKQAAAMAINLVDHGQEIVGPFALAPVDLVNPDRANPIQPALRQPPLHEPLHRAVNRFPAGAEGSGGLPPGQMPRPAGQKTHHGDGDRAFAVTPGNVFNDHAVLGTGHASRSIEEIRWKPPQRHEQPRTFRQPVISRQSPLALGAPPPPPPVRLNPNLDAACPAAARAEPDGLVNKTGKALNPVQNGLNFELDSWSPGRGLRSFVRSNLIDAVGISYCF